MKIVINKCFGGFGLSPGATKRLAELKGRKCYFFTTPRGEKGELLDGHTPISMTRASKEVFWYAYDIPNPDEILPSQANWHEMTQEQRQENNRVWNEHHIEHDRSLDRADPDLVQVVEELGKKADGDYAELKIVEIPDGVEYEIDEYDGQESIHETHRSWG